eukprot:scaffold1240_cov101-Isochrysis_galbana.AAC.9
MRRLEGVLALVESVETRVVTKTGHGDTVDVVRVMALALGRRAVHLQVIEIVDYLILDLHLGQLAVAVGLAHLEPLAIEVNRVVERADEVAVLGREAEATDIVVDRVLQHLGNGADAKR